MKSNITMLKIDNIRQHPFADRFSTREVKAMTTSLRSVLSHNYRHLSSKSSLHVMPHIQKIKFPIFWLLASLETENCKQTDMNHANIALVLTHQYIPIGWLPIFHNNECTSLGSSWPSPFASQPHHTASKRVENS